MCARDTLISFSHEEAKESNEETNSCKILYVYERSISEEEKVKDDLRLRILKSENKKYLPVTYTAKFSVVFLFSYLKDKMNVQT